MSDGPVSASRLPSFALPTLALPAPRAETREVKDRVSYQKSADSQCRQSSFSHQ